MASTIPALEIRRRLGREKWCAPSEFGSDGWLFDSKVEPMRIIVSNGPAPTGMQWWWHASVSRRDRMPSYDDLVTLHKAVWGDSGWSYQCFAPAAAHVNISAYVLHLWGLPDGAAALPNFGAMASI